MARWRTRSRSWDDYEQHSLKLTAAPTSGSGRTALRATSKAALHRRWETEWYRPPEPLRPALKNQAQA